jgi:aryl-alcohol dehydrogenase-like predicted oxidoreductase
VTDPTRSLGSRAARDHDRRLRLVGRRRGGWAFGWGPQDDDDSIRAIGHAVSAGVNWIDTAAIYGLGHSEEVVGRAMAGDSGRRTGRSSSPSAA